jgi:hypothetical protein
LFEMVTLKKPIEIFAPGAHRAADGRRLSFSREVVAGWAGKNLKIPLVPGHPATNEPVMGYATRLSMEGDRLRILEVKDVDPTFEAIVNSGQLNRVSIKLKGDDRSGYRVDHIGFLGTSRPSLGHLQHAEFAAGEVWVMPEDLEFAKRELELGEREAEFAAKVAEFEARTKWSPQVAKLVADGKVLPVHEEGLVALFCSLGDESIQFSAGGDEQMQPRTEFLHSLLSAAKPLVRYGETAATGSATPRASAQSAAFAASGECDDEGMEMHEAIVASGVDPRDVNAYTKAVKNMMAKKGGK